MTVNSLFFLLFLAVLYVVYYVCPLKYRWMVLLGAGVFFTHWRVRHRRCICCLRASPFGPSGFGWSAWNRNANG